MRDGTSSGGDSNVVRYLITLEPSMVHERASVQQDLVACAFRIMYAFWFNILVRYLTFFAMLKKEGIDMPTAPFTKEDVKFIVLEQVRAEFLSTNDAIEEFKHLLLFTRSLSSKILLTTLFLYSSGIVLCSSTKRTIHRFGLIS